MKKKTIISLTLAFMLLLGLSVPALADAPKQGGFYLVGSAAGITIKGVKANKDPITATYVKPTNTDAPDRDKYREFYPGAVQLQVTLANTDSTKQYALFLTAGDAITENTLKYIDQQGSGSSLTFYVYPAALTANTQLTLWITNSGGGAPVEIKLGYWAETSYEEQPYVLGDVDGDDEPSAEDATVILRSTVNLVTLTELQELAGDVDKSGSTDSEDATYILRYTVNLINSFDEIQV